MKNILLATLGLFFTTIMLNKVHANNTVVVSSDKTVQELRQQLKLLPHENIPRLKILLALANKYQNIKSDSALYFANTLLKEATSIGSAKYRVSALIAIGTVYHNNDKLGLALQKLEEARKEALKTNSEVLKWTSTNEIILVKMEMGKYAESISALQELYTLAKAKLDTNRMSIALNNMSYCYAQQHDYKHALDTYFQIEKLTARSDKYKAKASLLLNTGILLHITHRPKEALGYFEKAIVSAEKEQILSMKTSAQSSIALILMEQQQYDKALNYAKQAYSLNKEIKDLSSEIIITERLAEIYQKLGSFEESNRYREINMRLQDSLNLRNKFSEAFQVQDSIQQEKNQLKLNQLNGTKKRILTWSIIGLVLLGAFSLCIYLWNRRRLYHAEQKLQVKIGENEQLNRQLNEELDLLVQERTAALETAYQAAQAAQDREKLSLVMMNQQHLELYKQAAKQLEALQKVGEGGESQKLRSIIHELKTAEIKGDELEGFMVHFEKVHPQFFQRLQAQFPALTNGDLKHCAYVQMGMSRKQVADLLKTTDNAVKIARNRIKKKLGLTAEDSLPKYVRGISQGVEVNVGMNGGS